MPDSILGMFIERKPADEERSVPSMRSSENVSGGSETEALMAMARAVNHELFLDQALDKIISLSAQAL